MKGETPRVAPSPTNKPQRRALTEDEIDQLFAPLAA
jgi:hypothetical protein